MDVLWWIIGALIVVSLLGLAGVLTLWVRNEKKMKYISYLLIAFAAGTLIAGGLLDLIPEAAAQNMPIGMITIMTVVGFVIFLLLETYLHWHYCEECDIHAFSYMILLGDALHNLVDGVIIAAAFLTNIPLGLTTTAIIIAHEIPQELGIFGVQVYGGVEKNKALLYSLLSQTSCIIGGIAAYFFMSSMQGVATYILPFAAGGFIYIAASDLIPELHKEEGGKKLLGVAIFLIGILFIYAITLVE
ncbi:MAG: ZIP family metal transporter [Candidatus Micrarchaeota archaeon]